MNIVGEDKPDLDELMHYGVLGMKWGQRKKGGGKEIRKARRNLRGERRKLNSVEEARREAPKGSEARTKLDKKLNTLQREYNKNPDRVLANRLTRGEKLASVLLLGPVGLVAIGGTSARSRRVEQKQETNKYNK
jgi:hypothetical protein